MTPRTAFLLAGLGVATLGAGIALNASPNAAPAQQGQLAFPGLATQLQNAGRIDISGQGKHVTLTRTGDTWGVADRDGYKVDLPKLRALFAGLAELRLLEPRTADPALWGRLGVDDPTTPGSTALSLKVLAQDQSVLAETVLGHRSTRSAGGLPDSIYLRRPTDHSAWRAEGHLDADADPVSWLARDLLNVKSDDITRVEITRGDTHLTLSLHDGKLALDNPPPGKLDDIRAIEVAQALENMTLADVRKGNLPGELVGQAVFTTKSGQSITVQVSQDNKLVWANLTGSGANPALAGWAFQLPEWRLSTLVPQASDFVKPDQPAKPAPPG